MIYYYDTDIKFFNRASAFNILAKKNTMYCLAEIAIRRFVLGSINFGDSITSVVILPYNSEVNYAPTWMFAIYIFC